jgi:hypothetical protein
MINIRSGSIGLCVFAVAMLFACHKPRSETYRRVEIFSAGHKQIEFKCLLTFHNHDTFVGTTPWQLDLDLDTMSWCMCGPRCRIIRLSPASDRLWMWGFDGESLRLDKYSALPSDEIEFNLDDWFCYKGKP